jgi:hypothetical protein
LKFLADESVDRQIITALRAEGYSIAYVSETTPGLSGLKQERKAAIAIETFRSHAASFTGAFCVITEKRVRVRLLA